MSTIMDPARPAKHGYKALNPIAILNGYENGRLDAAVLTTTVRGLQMNLVSARKFKACTNAGILAGIALTSTGDNRPFSVQEAALFQRYDRGYFPGRADYNTYKGVIYSLKPGMAQVATPGTSNHGMARARDWAEMINGDAIPDSLSLKAKKWLASNAPSYGIMFEVSSEDWHGTDYAGDVIPQAVLDFENGGGSNPGDPGHIPPFDPNNGLFSLYPLDPGKAKIFYTEPNLHSDLVAYAQGVLRVKLQYALVADGFFGPRTRDFITWFQATHGLTADGIVGKNTWAAIDGFAVQ
jgi:hypothetical protein